MYITPISKFNYNNYNIKEKTNGTLHTRIKQMPSCDTVSFGAQHLFFMDALAKGYDTAEPNLIATAKEFHKSLRIVAEKLKAYGFDYDPVYNSQCPIKKKDSVLDKFERQGSAEDIVRGTIYWQDQQDVTSFKKFLDLMKAEGWELSTSPKYDKQTKDFIRNKNGNIIKFPDIEIRQEGVTVESLAPFGELLQRAEISKPRQSTYSDWQVRFIKTKDKSSKNDRRVCEVIFLYGPHYKDAKETEHAYVYDITKMFKKLHVDLDPEHHVKGSPGHIISENVSQIQKRLIQFISQPLLLNAFNTDLKIKDEKLPVEISKNYANLLMNYAKSIKKVMSSYYSQMAKELLKEEYITDSIKKTPSYMFRTDKTISPKEIKEERNNIKKTLERWKEHDIEIITAIIEEKLPETIIKFVVKD